MSLSEFFNRKARAFVAGVALLFGGVGGYVGHDIAQQQAQSQKSNYTLAQAMSVEDTPAAPEGMSDEAWEKDLQKQIFHYGRLPAGLAIAPETIEAQTQAREAYLARIGAMQEKQLHGLSVRADSIAFVNELRAEPNLSEQDYAAIVSAYNAKVGLDVTKETGNWQKGIAFQQEANAAVHFDAIFSFGDDDRTEAQLSAAVGKEMKEAQQAADLKTAGGALGGAALGGLLLVPAWLSLRRKYPVVAQAPKQPKKEGPSP